MKCGGWIDYSNPLSRRGGAFLACQCHLKRYFIDNTRVKRQVDPPSIYSVYSQPAGPLLASLIFPRRLLRNEQVSVVTYV